MFPLNQKLISLTIQLKNLSKIPFLKKMVFDAKKLFQKYDTVVNNIDKITNKIKTGRVNSIKDNSSLQTMFDSNVSYIKQMEELIISGQIKYNELNEAFSLTIKKHTSELMFYKNKVYLT